MKILLWHLAGWTKANHVKQVSRLADFRSSMVYEYIQDDIPSVTHRCVVLMHSTSALLWQTEHILK
jgi:hypothetical protein